MDAAASHLPIAHPARMPADESSALRDLTVGLARGDDAAWAQFHCDYGPGIFRQLLGATHGDHDLASEALQQTYLRVARHARPCDEPPVFVGWLRVVARSALNDCFRRRRSFWDLLRRGGPELLADPESADSASESRLSSALDHALEELTESDRTLLKEKYFTGTDVRSLASQLGISPKAVESRLTRARAELRRRMLQHLKRHE